MTSTNNRSTSTTAVEPHAYAEAGLSRGTRRAVASAVALIGAGAAATALAAPASASTPSYVHTWDRVAACESSGNWGINTGNGYHGGVQFSSSTWAANGGHKYARQAEGASKREQIEVARRVLKSQGPDAWPVCGPRAGLTRSSGAATSAALPASDETLKKVAITKAAAKKAAAKKAAAKKAASTATQPATAAKPVAHPAASAPRKHVAKHSTTGRRTYTVKSGDTLSGIAGKLHLAGGWHALFAANRAGVHNPNVLHIGQRLVLPKA